MKGYIDKFDWLNVSPMKYWSFSAGTSDETKRTVVKNAIFSGDFLGSLKRDGFYQRICKDEDGNCFMIARSTNVNGEIVDKYEWVPQIHEWMNNLPNGTCFLAEAYLPDKEGSKNVTSILGCLKEKALDRQKKTPLHFHVFDCMAFDGKSYHNTPYIERVKRVKSCSNLFKCDFVHYADFYEGEELWIKLQEFLAAGNEGMVIMRKDALVYDKRTPARVSIKVKKELESTIDCFFTGVITPATKSYTGKEVETWTYWENQITGEKFNECKYEDYMKGAPIIPITKGHYHNWAGSMEIAVLEYKEGHACNINGKILKDYIIHPIGWLSGITDDMRANPKEFSFKPIEVNAMELDLSNGDISLRHGKMKNWRSDLNLFDCTLNKIIK